MEHGALKLLMLVLAVLAAANGCDSSGGAPAKPQAGKPVSQKSEWPSPVRSVNSRSGEIDVLGGTTFRWGGVRCQLLGVKESDDPRTRELAKQFAVAWFKS